MKAVRIFLLILIIIGLGLIFTQGLWVPKLVNKILQYQSISQSTNISVNNLSQTPSAISKKTVPAASTARIILGRSCNDGSCRWYEKDSSHVYDWLGNLIKNADPNTFKPLLTSSGDVSFYEIDKQYAFFEDTILPSANPKTFELINGTAGFARDDKNVYAYQSAIPQADVATFTTVQYPGGISDIYAKDKNNVYYCVYDSLNNVGILDGADSSTFVVLGQIGNGSAEDTYAKDKNHVYWDTQVISNADLNTFAFVSNGDSNGTAFDAQDKNHKYFQGRVVQ